MFYWENEIEISDLLGKTIIDFKYSDETEILTIKCECGSIYEMHHDQECCENVYLYDIIGEVKDILNSEILMAEEETSYDKNEEIDCYQDESFTWTFYKIGTVKGYVTLRWFGSSNGYYGERVDFVKIQ
jgi:hypothetical protein